MEILERGAPDVPRMHGFVLFTGSTEPLLLACRSIMGISALQLPTDPGAAEHRGAAGARGTGMNRFLTAPGRARHLLLSESDPERRRFGVTA
ncbi:unnamed protein product [Gadus morhua 'NCC']